MEYEIPKPREGYVLVELVWPESRGEKNDCKAGTPVLWRGKGDVQRYPALLWPKLAPHPDVWRLYDPVTSMRELHDAQQAQREDQTEAVRLKAEEAVRLKAEEAARRTAKAKAEAAGTNTDLVVVTPLDHPYTAEDLAAMSDEDVKAEAEKRGYGLHPRLNPANLRSRFIEAQDYVPEDDDAPADEAGELPQA